MAIIVDKNKKRRDIALSIRDLILKKGIKSLTITDISKVAGISRGSVYDYFETKEEIVFELIINEIMDFQKSMSEKFDKNSSTREKIFYLYEFILSNDKKMQDNRDIYREYLSVFFSSTSDKMTHFNNRCSIVIKDILTSIIKDGIEKKELKKESINLIDGLLAIEKGFLVILWTEQKKIDIEFRKFLNTILNLIEIKENSYE